VPVGDKALTTMDGTTLCPHCNTRFKIAADQLEAHHGMVRCGHCLQAFDARPGYVPDQPSPQLELPMLDDPAMVLPVGETASPAAEETQCILEAAPAATAGTEAEPSHEDLLDFHRPAPGPEKTKPHAAEPTLAEQVAIVQDEAQEEPPVPPAYRRWPWTVAASLLSLLLLAQAAYFFRIELAARLPDLKPALVGYCKLLRCNVPLPQNTDLMSIESSDLEADPEHANQINLNALLRNRAPYPQAFPSLELTLNDAQDKPLARRAFKPKDYLPPQESEAAGLLPNHELGIKLHLDTADLRPMGYRLALFYPRQ